MCSSDLNPTDTALFAEERASRATLTAFGMTKRPGRSVANDGGLQDLLKARAPAICFVAKSWDYHVRVALGSTNAENLDSIRQSVAAARAAGREVLVDCEHFFDGYKANPDYAVECAAAALAAGARWVVLCDTNGGTLPGEVSEIVRAVAKTVPGDHLGIHAHNDTEQAVANSLAAVEAGCRQPPGGEGIDQGVVVHNVAARRIHEIRRRLHLRELRRAQQVLGLRRKWNMERDIVAGCE